MVQGGEPGRGRRKARDATLADPTNEPALDDGLSHPAHARPHDRSERWLSASARGAGLASVGWLAPVLLWAVAFALRAWLAPGGSYGDESAHYAVAKSWGQPPTNVYPADLMSHALWWQRPLFSALLWPGTLGGFLGYRVWHAALAALLPVAGLLLVRRAGAPRAAAILAGAAIALHPTFVLWGGRVFPDSLMATLALFGLERLLARQWLASAGLLLAATWVKEVAAVLILVAFAAATVRAVATREAGLYPLRADRAMTAFGAAGLLAPLPLMWAVMVEGGRMPGWSTTSLAPSHADALALSCWLLAAAVAALALPPARRLAAWALVFPGFYLAYGLLGRGVEAWYAIAPAALAVCAASAAAWALLRRRAAWGRPAIAVLLAVLAVGTLVPQGMPGKAVATPLQGATASTPEVLQAGHRPGDLEDVVSHMTAADHRTILLVDPGWFNVPYPFAASSGHVGIAYTDLEASYPAWAHAVDSNAATVLLKVERPMNQALRATYADCVAYENPSYVLLRGGACPGRADILGSEHRARGGAPRETF